MRKLVEAMPKAAMQPARTPTHPPTMYPVRRPIRFISIAAGMVPSASPRWLRLTGTVANCLLSASIWPTNAAERHHDCGVCTAERLRDRQHDGVAFGEAVSRGRSPGFQKCVYEPTS